MEPVSTGTQFHNLKYVDGPGKYVYIGRAVGAGDLKGMIVTLYKDVETDQMYVRGNSSFTGRMQVAGETDPDKLYRVGSVVEFVDPTGTQASEAIRLKRAIPYAAFKSLMESALKVHQSAYPEMSKSRYLAEWFVGMNYGDYVTHEYVIVPA